MAAHIRCTEILLSLIRLEAWWYHHNPTSKPTHLVSVLAVGMPFVGGTMPPSDRIAALKAAHDFLAANEGEHLDYIVEVCQHLTDPYLRRVTLTDARDEYRAAVGPLFGR